MSESSQHIRTESGPQQLAGSIIVTLVATVFIIALFWANKDPEAKLQELSPLKVVLTEVKRQDLVPRESLTGRLQPVKTVQLKFEVQG